MHQNSPLWVAQIPSPNLEKERCWRNLYTLYGNFKQGSCVCIIMFKRVFLLVMERPFPRIVVKCFAFYAKYIFKVQKKKPLKTFVSKIMHHHEFEIVILPLHIVFKTQQKHGYIFYTHNIFTFIIVDYFCWGMLYLSKYGNFPSPSFVIKYSV